MANKKVSMLRIRKLIQLTSRGLSQRKISKEVKMGRNIVAMYLGQIEQTGQSYQALLALDDSDLARLLLLRLRKYPKMKGTLSWSLYFLDMQKNLAAPE